MQSVLYLLVRNNLKSPVNKADFDIEEFVVAAKDNKAVV